MSKQPNPDRFKKQETKTYFKNYDCDEIKNYFEKSNRFKLN